MDDQDDTRRGWSIWVSHGNAERPVVDDLSAEGEWAAKPVNRPPQQPAQPPVRQLLGTATAETTPQRNTGRSGRQNAATRRSTRTEERATLKGRVKKQQPNGMSHGGGGSHTAHPL